MNRLRKTESKMENNNNFKIENVYHEDVYSENDFDLNAVKKMTSCLFLCEGRALFHWPIVDNFGQFVNKDKSWASDCFPINGNDQTFGQTSLKVSQSVWTLSLTLDRYAHSSVLSGTDVNSYFVCKCKYTTPTSLFSNDDDICQQHIMVFGTITNKSTASIRWFRGLDRHLLSVLVEIYQFSAEIPTYVTSNRNVVVGRIADFRKQTRENQCAIPGIEAIPRFSFGSEGNQQMTVRFLNNLSRPENLLLFSSHLSIKKEGEGRFCAPFVVTFTIFSEKKNLQDFVKRITLSGDEKEEKFDHTLILTFFKDIDRMLLNDVLYYKVVLEPVQVRYY